MTPKDQLGQRYPELRGVLNDPATQRLIADLESVYSPAPPPTIATAVQAALQRRAGILTHGQEESRNSVQGRAVRQRWARRSWRAPLSARLVLSALAVLGIGVPVALRSVGQKQFGGISGSWSVLLAKAGTPIGMFSDRCDVRVTLDRAYADANEVLLEYRVRPPSRQAMHSIHTDVSLVAQNVLDSKGASFRPVAGFSLPPDSHGEQISYQAFDASRIIGTPRALNLFFVVGNIRAVGPPAPGRPSTQACVQDGPGGADPHLLPSITYSKDQHSGKFRNLLVRPPYLNGADHLGFTVPFDPRSRVATLNHVVDTRSGRMELERIVVTPSETRLYVRGTSDERDIGSIGVGGRSLPPERWQLAGDTSTAYRYNANLSKAQGTWFLRVPAAHDGGKPQIIPFTVPGF